MHVTPKDFADEMERAIADSDCGGQGAVQITYLDDDRQEGIGLRDELYQRLGWMPRVHPIVLPSGRWILPLYTDTFSASIMAISDDRGKTWTASKPLIGFGNIQPSLVRKNDGELVAFMRDNGPHHKIRLSTSRDDGVSWSPRDRFGLSQPRRRHRGHPPGERPLGLDLQRLRRGAGIRWRSRFPTMKARPGSGRGTSSGWRPGPVSFTIRRSSRLPTARSTRPTRSSLTGQGSTIEHAHFDEAWLKAGDQK